MLEKLVMDMETPSPVSSLHRGLSDFSPRSSTSSSDNDEIDCKKAEIFLRNVRLPNTASPVTTRPIDRVPAKGKNPTKEPISRPVATSQPITIKVDKADSKPTSNVFYFGDSTSTTPTTPCTPQDEFLSLLEPSPVTPPDYSTLPPGGCPRFPVSSTGVSDRLPEYSPSIYKLAVVSRKVEWLTPYEPCPSRSWKSTIMELNSTQLNFYHVPNTLEHQLIAITTGPHPAAERETLANVVSPMTSDTDVQLYRFCKQHHLIQDSTLYEEEDRKHASRRMVRSYSLQHSKFGIAADYTKKTNVLRLRVESEQILIHFATVRELIEWNAALAAGRDIALDLNDRVLPKFRTVPRRRRNTTGNSGHNGSSSSISSFYGRSRSGSLQASLFSEEDESDRADGRFRGKLSRLKNKLSGRRLPVVAPASPRQPVSIFLGDDMETGRKRSGSMNQSDSAFQDKSMERSTEKSPDKSADRLTIHKPADSVFYQDAPYQEDTVFLQESDRNCSFIQNNVPDILEEFPRQMSHGSSPVRTEIAMPIHIPSESESGDHDSDSQEDHDESEDEHEFDEVDVPSFGEKWTPQSKVVTEAKYIRNCLRCIKPLNSDEVWVSRSIVKPASMSPLNLFYLKNVKYSQSSTTSLVSMASSSSGRSRRRSESAFTLPDSALTKVPNHFVKEYTVGAHGLIPKQV